MNNTQNNQFEIVDILTITGANICLFLTGIALAISVSYKISLPTIVIALIAGAIALLWVFFSRQKKRRGAIEDLIAAQVKERTAKTCSECSQAISKKDDEIKKLKLALQAAQSGGIKKSPEQQLKELQEFNSSFPLKLADGSIVNGMTRSEYEPNSHSRWTIYGESEEQLWKIEVLRPDVQKRSEMLLLLKGIRAIAELTGLNLTADQFTQ